MPTIVTGMLLIAIALPDDVWRAVEAPLPGSVREHGDGRCTGLIVAIRDRSAGGWRYTEDVEVIARYRLTGRELDPRA